MTTSARLAAFLQPWSGLALGGLGWAISHGASARVSDDCGSAEAETILLVVAGLLIAIGGLWLSLNAPTGATRSARFIVVLSSLAAVGFIVTSGFHLGAVAIIPPCLT